MRLTPTQFSDINAANAAVRELTRDLQGACNESDRCKATLRAATELLRRLTVALEANDDHRIHVATPVGFAHRDTRAFLSSYDARTQDGAK